MALTFPVPLADFWDKLPIGPSAPLFLRSAVRADEDDTGVVLPSGIGFSGWRGEARVARLRNDATVAALVDVLRITGGSFLAYEKSRPAPAADPTGAGLSGFSPQVTAFAANNREITLGGLPAGYVLSPGDFIGWTYASNPTRRALHRFVLGGAANGSGVTASLEVVPHVRPGAVAPVAAVLVKPSAAFVILSESHNPGNRGVVTTTGLAFDFAQTLR
ncbi:MAG: hypothetical protein H5U20_03135 [Rhodobacteraceae bacterium]|nr:hypothetical protein [Paracoccaceae bacterium]